MGSKYSPGKITLGMIKGRLEKRTYNSCVLIVSKIPETRGVI